MNKRFGFFFLSLILLVLFHYPHKVQAEINFLSDEGTENQSSEWAGSGSAYLADNSTLKTVGSYSLEADSETTLFGPGDWVNVKRTLSSSFTWSEFDGMRLYRYIPSGGTNTEVYVRFYDASDNYVEAYVTGPQSEETWEETSLTPASFSTNEGIESTSTITKQGLRLYIAGMVPRQYYWFDGWDVDTSTPINQVTLNYDFATLTDQNNSAFLEEYWNGTAKYYRLWLFPQEDSSNITIKDVQTTFTLAYVNPNCTYSDYISSGGNLTLTDVNEGTYEVLFNVNENWHDLHISMYAPDGVGLMWEVFPMYINNTRVPYAPNYHIKAGYYEYEVKDYFSQTVLTGNFTIYDSDSEDVYQNWEVPLYPVAFHNGDPAPYRVEITRNAITREYPLPPKGDTPVRLYGLEDNVEYTIEIYNTENGQRMDSYTLEVPNAPVARYANYDDDEAIDFPSYQWIEESMVGINGRITGQYQLMFLGFLGVMFAIIIQQRSFFKSIFAKPLVRDKRR